MLAITLVAHLYRATDFHFREAFYLLPRVITVRVAVGDCGNQHIHAVDGEPGCQPIHHPVKLITLLGGVGGVWRQHGTQRIAVDGNHRHRLRAELLLELVRQRGFTGRRQARQPDRKAG